MDALGFSTLLFSGCYISLQKVMPQNNEELQRQGCPMADKFEANIDFSKIPLYTLHGENSVRSQIIIKEHI